VVTFAISLVALGLADGCRLGREVGAEMGRLNGEWELVEKKISGKPVPRDQVKGVRQKIAGRDWSMFKVGDPSHPQLRAVAIDIKSNPKRIEFRDHPVELQSGLSRLPGRYYWVYDIDGDTLKVSHIPIPVSREYPARVDGSVEWQVYFEFRRIKKK
jgi:uncharacterized protein (TIGR03067 family)